jgi:hypothetical protein
MSSSGSSSGSSSATNPATSLDAVVVHLSETILATTAAVDTLARRVDAVALQVQQNECQLFALGEDVKALTQHQHLCLSRIDQLTTTLEQLANSLLTSLLHQAQRPAPTGDAKPG